MTTVATLYEYLSLIYSMTIVQYTHYDYKSRVYSMTIVQYTQYDYNSIVYCMTTKALFTVWLQ